MIAAIDHLCFEVLLPVEFQIVATIQAPEEIETDLFYVNQTTALVVDTADLPFDDILFAGDGSFDSGLRTLAPAATASGPTS